MFTKLRISSHNLHIETGRHKRPKKTPVENRYCTYCTGKNIEDEMHFVCDCELYKNIRTKFFEKISDIMCNFSDLTPEQKFVMILSCYGGDFEICKLVCKFVSECFTLRCSMNN